MVGDLAGSQWIFFLAWALQGVFAAALALASLFSSTPPIAVLTAGR